MNMNCNRISFVSIETISDVFFNIKQSFLLPGNFIFLWIDSNEKIRYFFEIDCFNYGFLIGLISLLSWLFIGLILNSKS